jgi:hypothetical protein
MRDWASVRVVPSRVRVKARVTPDLADGAQHRHRARRLEDVGVTQNHTFDDGGLACGHVVADRVQHVIIETLPTPHLEHQGAQSGLVREPVGRLGG